MTGYCPHCGRELTGLTVAARGYCEQHGWVWADWIKPQGNVVCGDCGATIAWEGATPEDCLRCGSTNLGNPSRYTREAVEAWAHDHDEYEYLRMEQKLDQAGL